jgi:hypothetical protein
MKFLLRKLLRLYKISLERTEIFLSEETLQEIILKPANHQLNTDAKTLFLTGRSKIILKVFNIKIIL